MSSDSGSHTPPPDNQYREAVASYRASVKWVVSSFGAVAAALVVGVQLTSLGRLTGETLVWAVVSVAVVFAAILAILIAAVRVLTPRSGTYAGFKKDRDFDALGQFLKEDKTPLRKEAQTAGELADLYEEALATEKTAWELYEADEKNALLAKGSVAARTRRVKLGQVVVAVTDLGIYLRVKQLFQQTMVTIYIGIAFAAGGAVAFAYLANPPTNSTTPRPSPIPSVQVHVAVNEPKTCVDLYLALNKLAHEKPSIGSYWPTGSLGAQDHACGFHNVKELSRFLAFLSHR